MALVFSDRKFRQCGNRKMVTAKFTGPAAYTAGGEVLTNAQCKADLGLTKVDFIHCETILGATFATGAQVSFDHNPVSGSTQGKFHIIDQTGTSLGAEIAGANTDFAACTGRIVAYGY